tara:strand:+ start:429 stop:857 length:429 start_codon:yes stop_codon:yes gene_type:complete
MKVKYKKLNPLAKDPVKANGTDAGFDLIATSLEHPMGSTGVFVEVCTGISFEIPKGHVGLLFPRSSITRTKHFLRNSVGVIDSGYRGEVKLRFSLDESLTSYQIGDKVGQIIFIKLPVVELIEADELSTSNRSTGGFGSSGR